MIAVAKCYTLELEDVAFRDNSRLLTIQYRYDSLNFRRSSLGHTVALSNHQLQTSSYIYLYMLYQMPLLADGRKYLATSQVRQYTVRQTPDYP
jgi:hypothetical protein